MITMRQPSLVLHSCDVPGYRYRMHTTWNMPAGARPADVVYWILYAADHAPELELRNVIINCHGGPGTLYVGGAKGPTVKAGDLGLFAQLRAKDIGTIWLVACKVALGGAGLNFCSRMAQTVGCDVVGADVSQFVEGAFVDSGTPFGCIDDFEGTAYQFSPSGSRTVYSIRA
jgi:hypothetical protein